MTALVGGTPDALALPPGTPASGTVLIAPATGTTDTSFELVLPQGAACPGDDAAGYRYHSFFVPVSTDPATITYANAGRPAGTPGFAANLWRSTGQRLANELPAPGTGAITSPISGLLFAFNEFSLLPAGDYLAGIACTLPDSSGLTSSTVRFWSTRLSTTGLVQVGTFAYAVEGALGAPSITDVQPGNGRCTVSFTPGIGTATAYVVTGLPSGAASGAASPITITGLTNGVAHELTVRATNGIGQSPPSATATCTPVAPPPPSGRIVGSGSGWAGSLVDDIRVTFSLGGSGVTVDYVPSGSVSGRRDYIDGLVDFAVSDVPFQTTPDDGSSPEQPFPGSYSYVPFSGGGLAFAYNLRIDGAQVTNLRLSGATIAAIFNGTIVRWNDPAITTDNPGLRLPDLAILPVVRSDRSGTSLQFASWLADQHPAAWSTLCTRAGRSPSCPPSQSFPQVPGAIGQAGDPGVVGLLLSPSVVGSIGYVNYSFALSSGLPVAKVRNQAGYYVEPTGGNAAMALRRAVVRDTPASVDTHMTADLRAVYTDLDPRSYPISYYSYLVVPGPARPIPQAAAVAFFARFAVCDAQQRASALGYAPLPVNLVAAGLNRIGEIPDADLTALDVTNCANPTIGAGGTDLLPSTVPMPPACDQAGAAQCPDGTGGLSGIPTQVVQPRTNVTGLTATPGAPGSGIVNLAWTPPAANTPAATPVSYAVAWTGAASGSATVPFGTNTFSLTGLSFFGNYTFTVTATYADPPFIGTPAATASAAQPERQRPVIQDISTTRPVGALVLTQVCNSNGAIPADPTATIGFPTGVPAVPALNASTVGNPATSIAANAPLIARGGAADPNFPEYPYPVNDTTFEVEAAYPTYCGVNLGRARFVTRGAGAGQFFAASGVINQITIVDTRDDDTGWTVSGQMGAFSANGGTDTFSGSQLGWAPQKTEDTAAFTDSLGNTYDQLATAGPVVLPNTAAATGLTNGSVLMQAAPNSGLGIAIADARLKLLIPVTADAGLYTGVLTFSAA